MLRIPEPRRLTVRLEQADIPIRVPWSGFFLHVSRSISKRRDGAHAITTFNMKAPSARRDRPIKYHVSDMKAPSALSRSLCFYTLSF
jgi:hypothetical protein